MKRLIGTVIVMLIATNAFAKNFEYAACTKDNQAVTMTIALDDDAIAANVKIPTEVGKAFQSAAEAMTADQFRGHEGYITFWAALSDADRAAINGISGAPEVTGTCKDK